LRSTTRQLRSRAFGAMPSKASVVYKGETTELKYVYW
jgi:hypothetical protein